MARVEEAQVRAVSGGDGPALASSWRRLTRLATLVAVLTSPAMFVWLRSQLDWDPLWALLATVGAVIAFRGLLDVGFRRFLPWPSLFGAAGSALEDDVVARRRAWYWRRRYALLIWAALLITAVWLLRLATAAPGESVSWLGTIGWLFGQLGALGPFALLLPIYFLFNFLILMGPMMALGITQIRGYEPGDADWGVRLQDVRGQAEAKEEVRRVITLWQSGEAFERAGGKRERGLLFLGAPGTGKTMLAKAVATGFNCPFVSIPGSGFAQTFIGMDAIIVRFLVRKAKRLARKWGGQCIIFIDEIDAVGLRRSTLGGLPGGGSSRPPSFQDLCFYGPNGALTSSGDLVLESRAWRERLFEERARRPQAPGLVGRIGGIVNQMVPGMFGGMGGGLALNQLLVAMDGVDNPPFFRRWVTSRLNTFLDATYIVPQRIGRLRLRLPKPRPAGEQVYFIGACNVPVEALDPALTRPGRMGRHVWFRTPTKGDRKDIFDLYLGKVTHEPDLDAERRRDELARITNGYSPAMIEQVCSMALTYAHHDGRPGFGWTDVVEAMTTVESGTAVGVQYVAAETRAVAIHEAGHAAAAHVFMRGAETTRLSIRMRGGSLGHHQALEKEERFSSWRHEELARLIWTLGAMAAERVFYGENSTGVGGDVGSATARAAWMVGACAMGPERVDLEGRFPLASEEEEARKRIMDRFEDLGLQIMRRGGGGGPMQDDSVQSVLGDREKRATAAQILGQAYVVAHNVIAQNRDGVEHIANVLAERHELHGDEVLELLDEAELRAPTIDLLSERAWPRV